MLLVGSGLAVQYINPLGAQKSWRKKSVQNTLESEVLYKDDISCGGREEAACAVVRDTMFILGGLVEDEMTSSVELWNAEKEEWQASTDMPEVRNSRLPGTKYWNYCMHSVTVRHW